MEISISIYNICIVVLGDEYKNCLYIIYEVKLINNYTSKPVIILDESKINLY